ncbi:hypothetical protein ACFVVQ_15630 [Paenibacillus chitinolyticus]|uniref:hypothetical protein n=1 Tax=Paenibacillus chitinolyticus TaxID=79263 RepID=UPI00365CDC66
MFKLEFKKAVFNKRMLGVIVLSMLLLFFSAYNSLLSSFAFIDTSADDLTGEDIEKIYEIGRNKYHILVESFGYMQSVFIFFIVFPYTASYVYERNKKYHYICGIRVGMNKYLSNKLIANSIAGGLALLIPDILYYIIISLTARNDILESFSFYPVGLYSNLFTASPDLYLWIQFFFHFILGFCFAMFALGFTSFFTKQILVYIIPFAVYLTYDIFISNNPFLKKYAITNMYNFMSSTTYSLFDFILLNVILAGLGLMLFHINKAVVLKNG